MLDSKFFFTLIGLVVAVFAICNTNMQPAISEGWGNFKTKVIRGTCDKQKCKDVNNNYPTMLKQNEMLEQTQMSKQTNFISRPNFQSSLSPRFSNLNYGAQIKYNMPNCKNLGVPNNPLGDSADMVYNDYEESRENFGCSSKGNCGGNYESKRGCGSGSGRRTSMTDQSNISENNNYISAMNEVYSSDKTYPVLDGIMAVGDMTTINSSGDVSQPVMYDRYVFANAKSRLRQHGCPFRGDLAIVPCGKDWFSVHPTPSLDLMGGAMGVMGGVENESSRALGELLHETSGGAYTTHGGVDMKNYSYGVNNFETTAGSAGSDIRVTAFP